MESSVSQKLVKGDCTPCDALECHTQDVVKCREMSLDAVDSFGNYCGAYCINPPDLSEISQGTSRGEPHFVKCHGIPNENPGETVGSHMGRCSTPCCASPRFPEPPCAGRAGAEKRAGGREISWQSPRGGRPSRNQKYCGTPRLGNLAVRVNQNYTRTRPGSRSVGLWIHVRFTATLLQSYSSSVPLPGRLQRARGRIQKRRATRGVNNGLDWWRLSTEELSTPAIGFAK